MLDRRHRPSSSQSSSAQQRNTSMQPSASTEWSPLTGHDGPIHSQSLNGNTSTTNNNKCCISRPAWYALLATCVILAVCVPLIIVRTRSSNNNNNGVSWPSVTQISTRDGIASGIYDGNYTLKQLRGFGSFGLGTFNGLDGMSLFFDLISGDFLMNQYIGGFGSIGEMVAIDGKFWQITEAGGRLAVDEWNVPFAVVTNAFEGPTGKDGAHAVDTGYALCLCMQKVSII
jgi:hypothetical protein